MLETNLHQTITDILQKPVLAFYYLLRQFQPGSLEIKMMEIIILPLLRLHLCNVILYHWFTFWTSLCKASSAILFDSFNISECCWVSTVHFSCRGLIAFHLSGSVLIHGMQSLVATLKESLMSKPMICSFLLCASLSDASTCTLSAPTPAGVLMGCSRSMLRRSGLCVYLESSVTGRWWDQMIFSSITY